MNAIEIEPLIGKLQQRLRVVLRTLEHVHGEQQLVDDSQELIDKSAYQSRCRLLNSLAETYKNEITEIDEALARVRTGQYGLCKGCHEPIPPKRLELAPQAAFCADCQEFREVLEAR
jgi:RNA polymerase-binding transcription factor DksA